MIKITAANAADQELLEKLAQAERQAVQQVYDLALPSVIHWVCENRGTNEDARDLFQEALIALFRKLEEEEFVLTCTLKSFLRIICRNLWLARLRDGKKLESTPLEACEAYELKADMVQLLGQSEEEQLFFHHFDRLDEKCRKILQWFFEKIALAQIARQLNTSEAYIKKRKFMCKEKLIKGIQQDPKFEELQIK